MKRIIVLLLLTVSSINTYAFCSAYLDFFPQGKTISPKSILVITVSLGLSEYVTNKNFPYYLTQGDEKIKLNFIDSLKGEFGIRQYIMVPDRELTVGKTYTLASDHKLLSTMNFRRDSITRNRIPIQYTVVHYKKVTAPQFINLPKEVKKHVEYMGCGPEAFVIFSAKVKSEKEFLIKATVKELSTGEIKSLFVPLDKDSIYIGHDMCTNFIKFNKGDDYEIKFDLIDIDGNVNAWKVKPLLFKKPDIFYRED